MTDAINTILAALGVAGQVVAGALGLVAALWVVGIRAPAGWTRLLVRDYELWPAFAVAAVATAGSLFFSEVANFVPCELCWFQRIFMYPLVITTLPAALMKDRRAARALLPLPVIGAGFSVYHLLVENHVVGQTRGCVISAPGGCATKWIEEFGYVTIPTLALTGFVLVFAFLLLGALEEPAAEGIADADSRTRHRS